MPLSSYSVSLLCPESPEDIASWSSDDWAPPPLPASVDGVSRPPLSDLLAAEVDHLPDLDSLSSNPSARRNAVTWILNVNEFYRFSPVTACLAVNYLHRFLSSTSLPGQNGECAGWPMQLLSVACVSVAAKMEEVRVPLLLDLQILDPKFVFESKTIRRMELLLMSALQWRMLSPTPFDFLDHFADSADPETFAASRAVLISRAGDLIARTCPVVEFWVYRPSVIAAAAIICALNEMADISDGTFSELLKRFNEWMNEEILRSCVQQMYDSLIDACPQHGTLQGPIGAIDAVACCDSQVRSAAAAVTGRCDPPGKRRRLGELVCTESI